MSFILPRVLAAGLALTVTGCTHITPLGPDVLPQPHHLRSPFVLQAMRAQPVTQTGGCPAGLTAFSGPSANPGQCTRPLGTPVTITSAAVSSVTSSQPQPLPGQQAGPAQYQITITLPAADVPALTAVTTTAAGVQGDLAISVGDRTWLLPMVTRPFTSPQLLIPLSDRNQALQLQRLLAPSG